MIIQYLSFGTKIRLAQMPERHSVLFLSDSSTAAHLHISNRRRNFDIFFCHFPPSEVQPSLKHYDNPLPNRLDNMANKKTFCACGLPQELAHSRAQRSEGRRKRIFHRKRIYRTTRNKNTPPKTLPIHNKLPSSDMKKWKSMD